MPSSSSSSRLLFLLLLCSGVQLAAAAAAAASSSGLLRPAEPAAPLVPLVKGMCCRELEAVPAEHRCRALRAMAEETPETAVGRACWVAQAHFAPTVVAQGECGLRTVHGIRFCLALGVDD
nr:unnamed protein product [Digitaria exilis]